MNLFDFIPGYTTAIYDTGRQPAFVMLLAFIVTFIVTRGYTRLARVYGWGSVSVGNVHTHHLVFGLITAFSAGGAIIGFTPPDNGVWFLVFSALFGIGVSLVLDEFALVFHLQDVYWEREGRKSIDAIILALLFGGLFLLRVTPFGLEPYDTGWWIVWAVVVDVLFAVVAALKGKVYMAVFGIFIPFLAVVAALRLAEPDSIWSRYAYKKRWQKKHAKSIHRYERYEQTWRIRKEKAWDLIGGKPGRPTK
ncbi:hypothetical protein KA047_00270 [Candidatus Saccharibacteria bacterium]|nr:hypothetical protein [Candidatus Saccharibacteria bacterium]